MELNEITKQLLRVRQEMAEALGAQAARNPLPAPDYVPLIGAYADDDMETHRSFATEESSELLVAEAFAE